MNASLILDDMSFWHLVSSSHLIPQESLPNSNISKNKDWLNNWIIQVELMHTIQKSCFNFISQSRRRKFKLTSKVVRYLPLLQRTYTFLNLSYVKRMNDKTATTLRPLLEMLTTADDGDSFHCKLTKRLIKSSHIDCWYKHFDQRRTSLQDVRYIQMQNPLSKYRAYLSISIYRISIFSHPLFSSEDRLYAKIRLLYGLYHHNIATSRICLFCFRLRSLLKSIGSICRILGNDLDKILVCTKKEVGAVLVDALSLLLSERKALENLEEALYVSWNQLKGLRHYQTFVSIPIQLVATNVCQKGYNCSKMICKNEVLTIESSHNTSQAFADIMEYIKEESKCFSEHFFFADGDDESNLCDSDMKLKDSKKTSSSNMLEFESLCRRALLLPDSAFIFKLYMTTQFDNSIPLQDLERIRRLRQQQYFCSVSGSKWKIDKSTPIQLEWPNFVAPIIELSEIHLRSPENIVVSIWVRDFSLHTCLTTLPLICAQDKYSEKSSLSKFNWYQFSSQHANFDPKFIVNEDVEVFAPCVQMPFLPKDKILKDEECCSFFIKRNEFSLLQDRRNWISAIVLSKHGKLHNLRLSDGRLIRGIAHVWIRRRGSLFEARQSDFSGCVLIATQVKPVGSLVPRGLQTVLKKISEKRELEATLIEEFSHMSSSGSKKSYESIFDTLKTSYQRETTGHKLWINELKHRLDLDNRFINNLRLLGFANKNLKVLYPNLIYPFNRSGSIFTMRQTRGDSIESGQSLRHEHRRLVTLYLLHSHGVQDISTSLGFCSGNVEYHCGYTRMFPCDLSFGLSSSYYENREGKARKIKDDLTFSYCDHSKHLLGRSEKSLVDCPNRGFEINSSSHKIVRTSPLPTVHFRKFLLEMTRFTSLRRTAMRAKGLHLRDDSVTSEHNLLVQVIAAFGLAPGNLESAIENRNHHEKVYTLDTKSDTSRNMSIIGTYIVAHFQNFQRRTTTVSGSVPYWKETLEFPYRDQTGSIYFVRDCAYLLISVFTKIQSTSDVDRTDVFSGDVEIPLSAIACSEGFVEGCFPVRQPIYFSKHFKHSATLHNCLSGKCDAESVGPSLLLAITLPRQSILQRKIKLYANSEDMAFFKYGLDWIRKIRMRLLSRNLIRNEFLPHLRSVFCSNINCDVILVCRYLCPQRTPPFVDTDKKAANFVSMIPLLTHHGSYSIDTFDLWRTSQDFLNTGTGGWAEHAVLLHNYFAWMQNFTRPKVDYDLYLVVGWDISSGRVLYVMQKPKKVAESILSIRFWNPQTGYMYTMKDQCPLTSISCLLATDNIYVNIQCQTIPVKLSFELSDINSWQSLFQKRNIDSIVDSKPNNNARQQQRIYQHKLSPLLTVQLRDLKYNLPDQIAANNIQNRLQVKLEKSIQRWCSVNEELSGHPLLTGNNFRQLLE
uniref:C2 domain-containing protein n=1 Tax=Aureoumbra lagunensis TaxID=44058 RepID=A0A7S3JSC9_9STRA